MNRMFRIIWSTALGAWVVASERATLRGKSGGNGGNGGRSRAMLASVGAGALAICCWSSPAAAQTYTWVGPGGGTFLSGNYSDTTAWSVAGSAPTTAGTTAVFSVPGGGSQVTVQFAGQTFTVDAWIASGSRTTAVNTGGGVNFATAAGLAHTGIGTFQVNVALGGIGAVTQSGTGLLSLNTVNSYTGGTNISNGTLRILLTGTLGATTNTTTISGGTLNLGSSTQTQAALNQSGGTVQTGTMNVGTYQLTGGTLAADATVNASTAFDMQSGTVNGVLGGAAPLIKSSTGTVTLSAANTYSGGTTVAAGTLALGDASHPQASLGSGNVSVASGAALGGYGQIAGSVQNSGILASANALPTFAAGPTGTLRVGGSVTNSGTLQLAAANGTPGNVLNIAGNYSGNGQIVVNTMLNQGGAASQSDRLVVGGNASGSTAIVVNRSGMGAQTVGDGIQLVQVGGTSAANSFRLAAPVQAGAYQYLLYQGGSTDANNWYLRSQLEQASAIATSSTAASMANSAIAYRPAVVGYSVSPLLNADYGFSVLGRLRERVGDETSADAAQPAHGNGIWGRIGGQNLDADAGSRFSADERTFFAQFGKDWTLSHDANGGSTHAGGTVTFGSTSASFSDKLRSITGQLSNATGTVETQAQSLGGYWTRYLPDGSYFDGVGQLTHYQNRYGDVFGDSASQDGFGAGVSAEVGKPFALGGTGVAIEPQAQLLYQYLHLNDFDDGISGVGANSTNGLRGRLGFRLFKANLWNNTKTSSVTPWFTADVLHDFLTPGQTNVGGTGFDNQLGKTWYELGLGLTGGFGKRSTVYASIRYARGIGGEYRRTVFGQAGYRFNW